MSGMPAGWRIESYAGSTGLCHDGDWYIGPSGMGCCAQCHPVPWVEFPKANIPSSNENLTSIDSVWSAVFNCSPEALTGLQH